MNILLKEQIAKIIKTRKGCLPIDVYKDIIVLSLQHHKKNSTAYFSVEYADQDYISQYKMFVPLVAENIAEIQATLAADELSYFEQALYSLAERDYLNATLAGRDLIPTDIDLDHPHYLYGVTVALFEDGIAAAPKIIERKVELTDEQYKWLAYRYMICPSTSFNSLRTLNPELFNNILAQVEANIELEPVLLPIPAFAIELTQIATDALNLRRIVDCIMQD